MFYFFLYRGSYALFLSWLTAMAIWFPCLSNGCPKGVLSDDAYDSLLTKSSKNQRVLFFKKIWFNESIILFILILYKSFSSTLSVLVDRIVHKYLLKHVIFCQYIAPLCRLHVLNLNSFMQYDLILLLFVVLQTFVCSRQDPVKFYSSPTWYGREMNSCYGI